MPIFARFRASEWIFLVYFGYVAVLSILFQLQSGVILQAWLVLVGTAILFWILARPVFTIPRDWAPLALVLVAYREMDWFSSTEKTRALERQWLSWDHTWLFDRGFRDVIEALGPVLPGLLELSYVLIYAVGVFGVATLYACKKPERVDHFLTVYAVGTLLSYALFPYFPSDPPRVVFPGADMPRQLTLLRDFNLYLVSGYGIHSSVFPSAHVSSAFAAAWGLLRFLPERPAIGWGLLAYAAFVAVATVYGRYHYGVDALAGIGISLLALGLALRMKRTVK